MVKYFKKKYNNYSGNKLFVDSFWSLIGNVAARGLGLLAAIIVARILGKDIYGEYGMVKSTLVSIAIFSTFGLGYTATKYVAQLNLKESKKIYQFYCVALVITVIISGILALFLFIGSNYIASEVLRAPHLNTPLKMVAVWIVFNALTTTQIGVLSGFGAFKLMAKINSIVGLITFILTLGLTYFFYFNGALLALIVSQVINWFLNYIAVKKLLPNDISRNCNRNLLKEVLKYSFPIALQEASYSITSWVSVYLLIRLTSFGELGLYTAAAQWSAVILFIPGILRNVILTHLSGAENTIKHEYILSKMLKINFLATLIPVFIVVLFSEFISSFYGESFNGLRTVLNIIVFTTIFNSVSNVFVQAYMSIDKNWEMFWFRLIRDIGTIILTVIFILVFKNPNGALVLSISTLITSFIFFVSIGLRYNYIKNKVCNIY